MRSAIARTLTVAVLGLCALAATGATAAETKKPEPDSLYVSSWEVGNKMFFTPAGWHGTHHYWMAGSAHGKMVKKDGAKKEAPPKKK